ncbi:glutamate--cysteine ligase [Pseudoclavibacter sp. AY1F1]|uniref:ExeM/NucH family extracellular endonuclease n=1 Tax=Pseudoclavibacter sp. AY1F1 TaxID=2080583 RepID=UPI000CE72ADD|nr:ExeM/NucH family extracellular endonuclease [Pseudoclavibacter sp. AY1F1]PPF47297.1 glutamate--cysteine ligase [Pseudoclavibacter sp. AY1F1]
MTRTWQKLLAVGIATTLAGGGLLVAAAPPTFAAPSGTDLVINEAYGGGGNAGSLYSNDFVELYNPSSAAISVDGWSVQYFSASGNLGGTAELAGSVAPHTHYLVSLAAGSGDTGALPAPDATGDISMGARGGIVALASTIDTLTLPGAGVSAADGLVDLIGYGSASTFEGPAPAPELSNSLSAQRSNTGVDSDVNSADFVAAAPTPENSSGGPTAAPEPTTTTTSSPTVSPTTEFVSIAEIQGTGSASPFVDRTVITEGVVTAVYAEGGLGGFNIQTPGAVEPSTHTASTGVFVYGPAAAATVTIGDRVAVTGRVGERFESTQISADGVEQLVGGPEHVVEPVSVAWPETAEERERYEGMLLAPAGTYRVSENYGLNQYGEVGLSVGERLLVTPTEVGEPGSAEAVAQAEYNEAHSVILDDGASTDFLRREGGRMINADIPLPYLSITTPVTVGATATFTEPVVVHYSFDSYRFQPTTTLTGADAAPVSFSDARETAPEQVGGDLQLGTFNVLNYFTSLGVDYCGSTQNYTDRDGNPISANGCLPRGAWDEENLARQEAKIVAAINQLDADIVALEEIEDSSDFGKDRDAALVDLVAALNESAGTQRWAHVPSPAEVPAAGDDVIRTAFIYQQANVEVVGASSILDDPAFVNGRAPLAQTFADPATGTEFIVVANHFKSKGGSGEGDNADNDDDVGPAGAVGGWNGDRTRQAQALVGFTETQRETHGTDLVFLTGDFNSYSQEGPMRVLADAGFENLGDARNRAAGEPGAAGTEYSYNFDGAVGSLDHILASGPASGRVTGADVWTINAYEQVGIEYSRNNSNVTQLYSDDVYRSSDHNPFLIGLDFAGEPEPTPTATQTPTQTPTATPTPTIEPTPTETSAPEPPPTSTEGVEPGMSPTMAATPPAAGGPSGAPTGAPGADGGELATTGAELGVLLPFGGGALLLAGALALLLKRRADQV